MSILSGFIKEKKYKKTASGYKLTSQYTDSSTVNMPDGNTAETNLGAIKGITSSLNSTDPNIAASAKSVSDINQSLNGNVLIAEGSGAATKYYIQAGADTASKKLLGSFKITKIGSISEYPNAGTLPTFSCAWIKGYEKLTKDNFLFDLLQISGRTSSNTSAILNISKSYDNVTGVLAVSFSGTWASYGSLTADVYCVSMG